MSAMRAFLDEHFRHYNARETVAAARGWRTLIEQQQGKMLVAIAGAMSTAELGRSLAEMIQQDKVHAISCTAANLEEDVMNLLGREQYRMVPDYRDLTPQQEQALREDGYRRVTDVCLPQTVFEEMFARLRPHLEAAIARNESAFPYEFFYQVIRAGQLIEKFPDACRNSWVVAAMERGLPIFTPGYEDSTMGNMIAAAQMSGQLTGSIPIRTGFEQMQALAEWYLTTSQAAPIGFFQIGGGIAADFAICVVPLLTEDLRRDIPVWAYFAQIGDSTTSYGSYSGAVPNEKITWGKLGKETPSFMIQSDATIVAPLIFAYVLGL